MEVLLIVLYVLLFIISSIPSVSIYKLTLYIKHWDQKYPERNYNHKVAVILPICGIEKNLEKRMEKIISNDYDNFYLILVTTRNDNSRELLEKIKNKYPAKVRTCYSDLAKNNSQKVRNQITALKHVDHDTKYLLFLDADGTIDLSFIRRITRPLDDENTGISTAWRWYIVKNNNFTSHVQSIWNAGAIPFLIEKKGMVFGGGMAVRYEDFCQYKIEDVWQQVVSDSLSMSKIFTQKSKKVVFVPGCMITSESDEIFSDLLSWTSRQTVISRIYLPRFWKAMVFSYLFSGCILLLTLILSYQLLGLWGLLYSFVLYWFPMYFNSLWIKRIMAPFLKTNNCRIKLSEHFVDSISCLSATLLYGTNILYSCTTRKIVWADICYQMINSNKTIVSRRSNDGDG